MYMNTTLVIMAAGIGSRFGGGVKQLTPVGPNGEIIIDYSIHDALEAGFNKIVFIIRKDIEKDFREVIGDRIEKICDVAYVFQELDDLPEGFEKPADRTKPWGTGQAVRCCKGIVNEPFAVINADDYYGKEAYQEAFQYLTGKKNCEEGKMSASMVGFVLKNTLSENGGVTRGVCQIGKDDMLSNIVETHNIIKTPEGAMVIGENGIQRKIDVNSPVSMNMWGLYPDFFEILENGFRAFLEETPSDQLKREYLLPTIIGDLLQEEKISVKVLKSHDKWFGVTYKEDKEAVVNSIKELIASGIYPETL